MSDQTANKNEQQRKSVAEELWLGYFNRILYEKGLITETERNRMTSLIANRSSVAGMQRSSKHVFNDKK